MALPYQISQWFSPRRSNRWWRGWAALILLLAGCSGTHELPPPREIELPPTGSPERTVHVVSNGFHTALVLVRSDLPSGQIPEIADFPRARYLEFSWGDAEFFPADRETLAVALRAAILPTAAVMHVVPLRNTPAERYPSAEIVQVFVTTKGFARLVQYLGSSFERRGADRSAVVAPGLYSDSLFYSATGRFHLGNTCNSWTARGLAFAGVKVDASLAASAEGLMDQLRSAD